MASERFLVMSDKALTELDDARVERGYRFTSGGVSVDLDDDGEGLRSWLGSKDDQATIARDRRLRVPVAGAPQDSHGLDSADPALADLEPRQDVTRGLGVRVGLADTGIRLHKWLNGAFFARPSDWEPLDVDGDDMLDPQAGHGLFVAGLILQQAPGAHLHVARPLSPLGIGDTSIVMRDVLRLVDEGVDVLNLSLGTYADGDPDYVAAWTKIVKAALAIRPELVIVCPAGNLEDNRVPGSRFYPGAIDSPNVVSVAALAVGSDSELASFSNAGGWVDFAAPGEDLLSTYLRWVPSGGGPSYHGYAYWSGTSFATAVVTGAIAARISQDRTAMEAVNDLKAAPRTTSGEYSLPVVPLDTWALPRSPGTSKDVGGAA